MKLIQYSIWLADLNPSNGTESGKIRPVVVVQSNLLIEAEHPSTIICPLTANIKNDAYPLRIRIQKKTAGIKKDSDIMVDQIRAIDNKRFVKCLGVLPMEICAQLRENMMIVLDYLD